MTRLLAWATLPALLLGLVVAAQLAVPSWLGPSGLASFSGAPPVEQLAFERVLFDDEGISVLVRAGAGGPVRVAQVQVDGAFWRFAQDPLGTLPRLSAGWLRIPYPWVLGEGHEIAVVTGSGSVFQHQVPRAAPATARAGLPLAGLLAACAGVLPLVLAGAVPPALRAARRGSGEVAYAVSVACLLCLLVATVGTALGNLAETNSAAASGVLVWLAAASTAAGLIGLGWLCRAAGRTAVAAVGVAPHRLCQGLAVGSAVALGSVTLAVWLALGFLLHNLLAGVRLRRTPVGGSREWPAPLARAVILAVPPLAGAWLGARAAAPFWAAMALAAGAGAILQVAAGAARFLVHHATRSATLGRGLLATVPATLAALHLAA